MPNLVISDIMMPEMRGDELCHILKNDIETSHIPIILLTALNTDKNIIEGLQSGADEYIVKPFNIGILRANIANLLTNRALLRHKICQPGPERREEQYGLHQLLQRLGLEIHCNRQKERRRQYGQPKLQRRRALQPAEYE